MNSKSLKGTLMLILTAFIWGVAFVAQSVSMDYVGPFTFTCVRNIIGGAVLIPCIYFLDKMKKKDAGQDAVIEETKEDKKTLIIGGVCCGLALAVASGLQQIGVSMTTVGKAGFITALYIVIVPIMGIFLKKKVGARIWISVVISVIGLYLLCMSGSLSMSLGDVFVLLCAVAFSVHILIIDHFSPKVDGVKMSCIQFFVCGIVSIIPMLTLDSMFFGKAPSVAAVVSAWVPVLYAGVLSCGVAYTLQVVAQKNTDPTVASLVLSLESVFSVLAGWVILGQTMSAKEITGCVLMFGAIILAQLPSGKKKEAYTNTADRNIP